MGKNPTDTTNDELVEMHKRARVRKKRKLIITLVIILVAVTAAVIVGVTMLRKKVNEQVNSASGNEVESAEVTIGSISTTVSGSGTLEAEDVETLEILSTLEIVDYYVEAGDSVEAGDLIAAVTNASLLTSMSEKQEELDALDEELAEASGDEVSETITAGVAGRVKKIYVSSSDDIATAMYENGALMLLSLDGYMAVDVASETLQAGDSVTVTLGDGSSVAGLVEKQVGGTAVVLVTDNGTTYGDTVTVYNADGTEAGNGTLYIHSQMMIAGYTGTVSSVNVSENESVSSGETLLTLTDTETSANYDALLKERGEVEEQLNELIKIYKEGGVCATISGVVDSIESGSGTAVSGYEMQAETSAEYTTVATISPDTTMAITISVDEMDILSLSEGQEATVTIDSIGEDSYEGVVAEVNTTASSDSGVTSYSAVIHIDKTEEMLSGMSASVVITIEGNDNAMLIPIDALHQTSATAYVYTGYDESTGQFSGMQEVTIGLSNSNYVEITGGLSEGDTVYYTATEEESPFGSGMMDFGNTPGGMSNGGGMPDSDSMPGGGNMPGSGSMPGNGNMQGGNMQGGSSSGR
ncbi:MAG: HlyD family efflux transporter periplasmic adaptor subunit [Lachnospiraceae bacterium]|nr:HlyD family efflux transporter periplasmic adaptor subunit [Lachnospiraceae bacterium]